MVPDTLNELQLWNFQEDTTPVKAPYFSWEAELPKKLSLSREKLPSPIHAPFLLGNFPASSYAPPSLQKLTNIYPPFGVEETASNNFVRSGSSKERMLEEGRIDLVSTTRLGRISRNNFPRGLERFAEEIHKRETLYSQTWTLCPNTVNPGKRQKAYSGISPSLLPKLFSQELEADGLLAGMNFQWMGIAKVAPRKAGKIYTVSQFPSSASLLADVFVPAIPADKEFPVIKGEAIRPLKKDLSFHTVVLGPSSHILPLQEGNKIKRLPLTSLKHQGQELKTLPLDSHR